MELSFVVEALRRYAMVVVACTVLGGVLGYAIGPQTGRTFEARAVMILLPAKEVGSQSRSSGENDRYIAGQVELLSSQSFADRVAATIADGSNGVSVAGSTTIVPLPGTDVVQIIVATQQATRARDIANAYASEYLSVLESEIDNSPAAESERLDGLLSSLRTQISDVDTAIREAMAPFVPSSLDPRAENFPPLPSIEQVAPELVSDKNILLSEYNQVLAARTSLGIGDQFEVASRLLQPAALPVTSWSSSNRLLIAAGLVGGCFFGALAAVVLARITPRLLSVRHAEVVSGITSIELIPRVRSLNDDLAALISQLPPTLVPAVDSLCIRAESGHRVGDSLSVVVAGVGDRAGTTTLAAAMASRYAALGLQVVLVDADQRNPQITRMIAADSPGVSSLLTAVSAEGAEQPIGRFRLRGYSTSTSVVGLEVLGVGDVEDEHALKRKSAGPLMEVVSRTTDVAVFDVGPLLAASSSVQLALLADAVVLAIPHVAHTQSLEMAVTQLDGCRGTLLGSWTRTSNSLAFKMRTLKRNSHHARDRGQAPTSGPLPAPAAGQESTRPATYLGDEVLAVDRRRESVPREQ